MKKKVIAYICIVAIVFLFMYFRTSIYYVINERDGFYIDIGHEPNDQVIDIAYQEDLYMLSKTRAKSGGVSYHAFTRLSSEIDVEVERSLDALTKQADLPDIEEMLDLLVLEDVYILYKTNQSLEENHYILLQLSKDGAYIESKQLIGVIHQELLVYQDQIMVLHFKEDVFTYATYSEDLRFVNEEVLLQGAISSFQDALIEGDQLYMLLERDMQYGLYHYNLNTKDVEIGPVDPKIKRLVYGQVLYLLEYQGDYLKTLYLVEEGVLVTGEIAVPAYRYYSFLSRGQVLYFYGGVNVGDEIHASYGQYNGDFTNQVLDVPYNNYFLNLIEMEDSLLYIMRTNYLMDYQIRKTIYTEDDVFYRVE